MHADPLPHFLLHPCLSKSRENEKRCRRTAFPPSLPPSLVAVLAPHHAGSGSTGPFPAASPPRHARPCRQRGRRPPSIHNIPGRGGRGVVQTKHKAAPLTRGSRKKSEAWRGQRRTWSGGCPPGASEHARMKDRNERGCVEMKTRHLSRISEIDFSTRFRPHTSVTPVNRTPLLSCAAV